MQQGRSDLMTFRERPIHFAVLATLAVTGAAPSLAQNAPSAMGITEPSIATSLPHNGDPTGLRKRLYDYGVSYNVIYTNDVLSNLSGGIQRGTIDQGKFEGQLLVNLEKLAGWKDTTFYANAFGIYNTGRIRRDYVGGMNTIAAIEATPTVRLSELWIERWIGPVSFRIGQLAADAEFFYSDLSQIFLQSDWPTIGAVNLPSGGPAYPLSALGARIKYEFPKDASLLLAIFNGDPAGPCLDDPDTCNLYGVNFRLQDPAFMLGELQFRRNRGKGESGLATTLKIGGWSHLGQFADKRFDNTGMLLASPTSTGVPLMHRGDYGIYAVIDQQIYRPQGGSADSGIAVFSRGSISPQSDRNLVNFYIDGGIVFAGLVPKRPNDTFGASAIFARFSDSIRGFDQDRINFGTLFTPARDYEFNLELTYVAQIVPGWTVQPVYTSIWHPSQPSQIGIRSPDAQVAGIRSVIRY